MLMIAPVNSKGYEEFEFSITFTIYLSINAYTYTNDSTDFYSIGNRVF